MSPEIKDLIGQMLTVDVRRRGGAVVTGLAVPGFETVVRPERDPAFVFLTRPPEQHLFDRTVEVVVADLVDRDSAQAGEPTERGFVTWSGFINF